MNHFHFDEKFWVALSFVIFCIAAYKPFKALFIKGLAKKVDYIKNLISSCAELEKESSSKLKQMELNLKQIKAESEILIKQANSQANKIIGDAKIVAKKTFDDIEIINVTKIKNLKSIYLKIIEAKIVETVFNNVTEIIKDDSKLNSIATLAKKIK
jgi:F0F1-type ATP synthase membrane subunit b/b'